MIKNGTATGSKSPLLKCLKYSDQEEMFTCERCEQIYRRKYVYKENVSMCNEERNMGEVFNRAMGIAYDIVYEPNSNTVYSKYDKNPKLDEFKLNAETDCREVEIGWAAKSKWGDALGGNTINEFKAQSKEWFDVGSHDPEKDVCV